MSTTYTFIKNTEDGRKVEVIGAAVCLNGVEEAYALVPLEEHPNRQAIQRAVDRGHFILAFPQFAFVAGFGKHVIQCLPCGLFQSRPGAGVP